MLKSENVYREALTDLIKLRSYLLMKIHCRIKQAIKIIIMHYQNSSIILNRSYCFSYSYIEFITV